VVAKTPDALIPQPTELDDRNRLNIPKHFSEKIPWLKGDESVLGWLWLLTPGRYRLLSNEQVQSDPKLEAIRELLLQGTPITPTEATVAEKSERAAVVARLAPVLIAAPSTGGPNWRIPFPKLFGEFVPAECNPIAFTILFSPEGYFEIWHTQVLRTAVLK
jgi:hypothetical protein